MIRKMIGFSVFVMTGIGLLINSFIEASGINISTFLLIIIGLFYFLGITAHLKELREEDQ